MAENTGTSGDESESMTTTGRVVASEFSVQAGYERVFSQCIHMYKHLWLSHKKEVCGKHLLNKEAGLLGTPRSESLHL